MVVRECEMDEVQQVLDRVPCPTKSCDHYSRIGSVHYFVVGQLENSFCSGKLSTDEVYIQKALGLSKGLKEPVTELVERVGNILTEHLWLLQKVHEDSVPLATEHQLVPRRPREPRTCQME